MTEAWFCPSCQKYHAPHVETCPGGGDGAPDKLPKRQREGVRVKRSTEIRLCPECGLPPGQCDPDGIGHYRG